MTTRTLELVSFVPPERTRGVLSTLTELGYRPVEVHGPTFLETSQRPRRPGVLLFNPATLQPRVLDCLQDRSHLKGHLALLDIGSSPWDRSCAANWLDFALWPCSPAELSARLDRLGAAEEETPPASIPGPVNQTLLELNLVGDSAPFRAAVEQLSRVAASDVTVLLLGETGTGKELAARAIHYLSARNGAPFIPVNCGALPDDLLESELFGHVRGAFTDAKTPQAGLVELAEGGTLFLDEVDTLSPKAQVALLRFLQNHEYRPVGSARINRADVRVVAATNKCLLERTRNAGYREDLFYRLSLMPIHMPPLRLREGDIPMLTEHFLERYRHQYRQPGKHFHGSAMAWLQQQRWPGNIRELENLIHRAFLLVTDDTIRAGDLFRCMGLSAAAPAEESTGAAETGFSEEKERAIADFERGYVENLLAQTRGNVSEAARIAGKERRALGKLIKKHGIRRADFA